MTNKNYQITIEKNTEIDGDWYILEIYDKQDDKIVMSTTDSLTAIFEEAGYWLKKSL